MHPEAFCHRGRWSSLGAVVVVMAVLTGGGGGGGGVGALSCQPGCDPPRCPIVEKCSGGTVPDRCGCCLECARVVNETCGGPFRSEGKCDDGLFCEFTVAVGARISDGETGFCRKSPPLRLEASSSCENVTCGDQGTPPPPPLDCPADSVLITAGHSSQSSTRCCPPSPACTCKPCPSVEQTSCPTGSVPVLKTAGSRQPGNCCDIHECIDLALFCDHVVCDSNASCPQDSIPLSTSRTVSSEDSCCPPVKHECTCKPKSSCTVQDCPPGLRKRMRNHATGSPGSCCDQFECINGSNPVCIPKGVIRSDGETWKLNECINCTCQKGLTICEQEQCPVLQQCTWFGRPEGQCCDVCKGCVSETGELYLSGVTWEQDSCVTCQCDEGKVHCQAQFCAVTCSNPRMIPGQCCPVCDTDHSFTLAPHCPTMSNCTLMCPNGNKKGPDGCYRCQCKDFPDDAPPFGEPSTQSTEHTPLPRQPSTLTVQSSTCVPMVGCTRQCSYGYSRDRSGCFRCRCNKCPLVADCTKKCASGFVYNADGCRLCKCLDSDLTETVTTPTPADTRRCISFDGERLEEGQIWWDGCRKCFCHQGQEMCALIICPAIRCVNPVMRSGSCCPSCGGEKVPPLTSGVNVCQSSDGRYFVEGETWQLDECTQCICHQGSALCTIDGCPPTLCHQPVVMPHSCCPVCPDRNGFLPPQIPWKKQPLRSCRSAGGNHYSSGDTWQVNACQSCTCHDGQVHCFSQTCPILRCNKTFLKKNQCCPMCLDNSAKYCSYDENVYSLGETWLVDDCTKCICSTEGRVLCMVTVCDVPRCKAPINNAGQCCPSCQNVTENLIGGHFPGSNATAAPNDDSEQTLFNSSLAILLPIVAVLILFIVVLLVLLFRKRRRREFGFYNTGSRQAPMSPFPFVTGPNCCQKPTNLDYKIQNSNLISAVIESSKLSSSEHNLKPVALSCHEAKPSYSDESLLNNSFPMGCTASSDCFKMTEPRSSPTALDFEIRAHFHPVDHIRMKHANRYSAGDELEQTRHLLTATPSPGVTSNNRKSW